MLESSIFSLKELITTRPVWLVFILFIGFVFAPGAADVDQLRQAGVGDIPAGKIIRVVSVAIVGILAVMILFRSGRISYMLKGNLALMTVFSAIAMASVASSPLKALTAYKSAELFVIIMVAATAYTHKVSGEAARKFIVGLLWLYMFTLLGAYAQLLILGKDAFHQISNTTFQTFKLISFYPPIAANSLGFMGAIVTLFGAFVFFAKFSNRSAYIKAIGVLVIIASIGIVALSYTRLLSQSN